MTTKELAEHNAAWDKAKAEIFAAYPYDTNFGAYLPASLFSKVAQRAEEIRKQITWDHATGIYSRGNQ